MNKLNEINKKWIQDLLNSQSSALNSLLVRSSFSDDMEYKSAYDTENNRKMIITISVKNVSKKEFNKELIRYNMRKIINEQPRNN